MQDREREGWKELTEPRYATPCPAPPCITTINCRTTHHGSFFFDVSTFQVVPTVFQTTPRGVGRVGGRCRCRDWERNSTTSGSSLRSVMTHDSGYGWEQPIHHVNIGATNDHTIRLFLLHFSGQLVQSRAILPFPRDAPGQHRLGGRAARPAGTHTGLDDSYDIHRIQITSNLKLWEILFRSVF